MKTFLKVALCAIAVSALSLACTKTTDNTVAVSELQILNHEGVNITGKTDTLYTRTTPTVYYLIKVLPDNATNKEYSVDAEKGLTVINAIKAGTGSIVVTPIAAGQAKLFVKSDDGNKEAWINIVVIDNSKP